MPLPSVMRRSLFSRIKRAYASASKLHCALRVRSAPACLDPLEEELLPYYNARDFFPVQHGKIYNERYQTVAKLGFGGSSTVWLARDLTSSQAELTQPDTGTYAVLKFCTSDYANREAAQHEVEICKRLCRGNSSHEGLPYVQTLIESFEATEEHGTHVCLVFEPMRETLSLFQSRLKNKRFTLELMKMYVLCLLHGLDYLHSECRIVHADLKPDNILLNFEDESVLEEFVQAQSEHPQLRRNRDGHSIYQSQNQFGPLRVRLGPIYPIIADFGHAHWIDDSLPQINPIQPDNYRAPEVILGLGWGSAADIWNFGVLLWSMLEGSSTNLFTKIHSSEGKYMAKAHLGQMIALLGPPPQALILREQRMRSWNFGPAIENDEKKICHKVNEFYHGPFFDGQGKFLYPELVPEFVWEDTISSLEEGEKYAFLDFVVGNMLCWEPEKRKTAKELLQHPWLAGVVLPWE